MKQQILEINVAEWHVDNAESAWSTALEAGNVLYLPHLAFTLSEAEQPLLTPAACAPKIRSICLDAQGQLTGAVGDAATQAAMAAMIGRFRQQTQALIGSLLPRYAKAVRLAPTNFRPLRVETRTQAWRADDRRLHLDASPTHPNYGERILRVFANIHPAGLPRMWRIGEPFEVVARHFLPRVKKYSARSARLLYALRRTKSLRSEYDHLMLQLHDQMKSDLDYQQDAHQITVPFAAGSVWICFSDQTSHAAMSGQYLLEQTMHLPVAQQYDPGSSPLAILGRITGRALV
jgi:hypothetical protein